MDAFQRWYDWTGILEASLFPTTFQMQEYTHFSYVKQYVRKKNTFIFQKSLQGCFPPHIPIYLLLYNLMCVSWPLHLLFSIFLKPNTNQGKWPSNELLIKSLLVTYNAFILYGKAILGSGTHAELFYTKKIQLHSSGANLESFQMKKCVVQYMLQWIPVSCVVFTWSHKVMLFLWEIYMVQTLEVQYFVMR